MENEIWKKIPGYSMYEASDLGMIKTFNWKNQKREAIMKPALDGGGYLRTVLINDSGRYDTVKVHRIIAYTFLENKHNKETINHKNGIKSDNRVLNLEWATKSENVKHAFKNFFCSNKGELNPCASLTDKQVMEIRSDYVYGKMARNGKTKIQIAKEYGTTFSVIKRIVDGKTWKHLL